MVRSYVRIDQSTQTENRFPVAVSSQRQGKSRMTANGYGISLWGDENGLKLVALMTVKL